MDPARSDDVEAVVRDAFGQARRDANKKNRPKADRRPPPDRPDAQPGDQPPPDDAMAMIRPDELVFADRRMVIEQSEYLIEVTSKRAGYRRYKIGSPISRTGPGGTFEIVSGWNGKDFYAVSENRRGMEIVERYSLSEDGTELVREMTIDAKFLDDTVVVMQVYYPET